MKKWITTAITVVCSFQVSATVLVNDSPVVIGESFGFVEGPVWDEVHQRFLFSDIPNHKIYSYQLKGKVLSVFDDDSGYANGLAIDDKGNLWTARHDRKLSYTQPNGNKVVVATTYNGHRLNSPNDLAIKTDGSVWFTDPPFGIQGSGPEKAPEAQPVRGIYRYQDGRVTLLSGDLKVPNGIGFSPDESYLYVANTADGWVYRFQVDGRTIRDPKRFAKVRDPSGGQAVRADGLKVDRQGRLFAAGPGGVGVFDPQGKQIDYIPVQAKHISNVEIGGPGQKQLMITAFNRVLLFHLK
jgi:gluconolactonase